MDRALKIRDLPSSPLSLEQVLEAVRERLSTMRYGEVALTVHDAKIVQMEVTEKRRF